MAPDRILVVCNGKLAARKTSCFHGANEQQSDGIKGVEAYGKDSGVSVKLVMKKPSGSGEVSLW